ncbi:MAG: hypothetical protein RO009_13260 [Pseudorhodoplanes sp.]|nr:hypothetical protein [Pseudorhodoplanes sp.]
MSRQPQKIQNRDEKRRKEHMREAETMGRNATLWTGLAIAAAIVVAVIAFANMADDDNVASDANRPANTGTTGTAPSADKPGAPDIGPTGN